MGHKLARMAYSSIIRESEDFGCVLCDAEGLQFNAVKIEEEGRKNDFIWQLLRDNCRAPHLVVGDMEAQVAACKIGAGRFVELIERYGIDTVRAASEDLMDYADRMLRREIE